MYNFYISLVFCLLIASAQSSKVLSNGPSYKKNEKYEDTCTKWAHYEIIIDENKIAAKELTKLKIALPRPQSLGSVSFKDCISENG